MTDKQLIIKRLAASLQKFYPDIVDSWMCPICLRIIPRSQPDTATEAHIVPEAAGGRISTVLCNCNSEFGAQQDKWLGDYLRMLQSNLPFPFSPPRPKKFFKIDGFPVGSRYDIHPDNGVRLIIDIDKHKKTKPVLRNFLRSCLITTLSRRLPQRNPEKHTLSLLTPLLSHKEHIEIGFLTAAYLLWFRALGYSWALQQHLDPIREQIRDPSRQVLPPKFSARCEEHRFDLPWIGIGEVSGELTLLAGIKDHIVLLPPADKPNIYDALSDESASINITPLRTLPLFYAEHQFGGPVGIQFDTRAIVVPDVFRTGWPAHGQFIYCPPDGGPLQVSYPIPETEYEQVLRSPNVVHIDLRWPV